jgi:hypothetical protein
MAPSRSPKTSALLAALLLTTTVLSMAFAVQAAPVITGISPSTGTTNGGTTVTITGTGFEAGALVEFGTVRATAITVTATSITAVTPPQAAGTVQVKVTNPDLLLTTFGSFTYTTAAVPAVSSVSPQAGPSTGGTTFVITGTNFGVGARVFLDTTLIAAGSNTPAGAEATVVSASATSLTVVSPPRPAGTYGVAVFNPDGQNSATSTNSAARFGYTQAAAPTLSTGSIASGPSNGGSLLTLSGTNFAAGATVRFVGSGQSPATEDTAAAAVIFGSSTTLTVVTPKHTAGPTLVEVTNPDGTSPTTQNLFFTFIASTSSTKPTITAVSPNNGTTFGGTAVTLTGTNFHTGSNEKPVVRLGTGTDCATGTITIPSKDVTVVSATSLDIVIPAGTYTAGAVDVCVRNPAAGLTTPEANALGVRASGFTFVAPTRITSVTPTTANQLGDDNGGSPVTVTLTGTGFPPLGGTKPVLKIGGVTVPAGDITLDSATSMTFRAPARTTTGVVDIQMTLADGKGATLAKAFTYTASAAPTLDAIAPTTGPSNGGTLATITGTGFSDHPSFPPTVSINNRAAIVCTGTNLPSPGCTTAPSATSIQIITPAHTSNANAGNQKVKVTNPDGKAVESDGTDNSDDFDYAVTLALTLLAVSPTSGPSNGGTVVTLTGTNFAASTAVPPTVTVGGRAATLCLGAASPHASCTTGPTGNALEIVVPAHTSGTAAPNQKVKVTNPNGASIESDATDNADDFDYLVATAPNVQSVSPTTAAARGGDLITVSGTGFATSPSELPTVHVGTTAAVVCTATNAPLAGCVAPSGTSLTILMPGRAPGAADVKVTNPNTQTSTLSGAVTAIVQPSQAPSLTSASPATGPAAGGSLVTLTGTNFPTPQAGVVPTVTFGGTAATVCTAANKAGATDVPGCAAPTSTTLTVVLPARAAGRVNVLVTNPDGQAVSNNVFRYIATPPTLSASTPASGRDIGGATMALTGTFSTVGPTAVVVGGVPARTGTVTASTVAAVTPPPRAPRPAGRGGHRLRRQHRPAAPGLPEPRLPEAELHLPGAGASVAQWRRHGHPHGRRLCPSQQGPGRPRRQP